MDIVGQVFPYLLKGSAIGFSAGIAPGPLTVLVITQTVRYSWREGAKVAIAPVLTDIPIIILIYFLTPGISTNPKMAAIISFFGALFLLQMAIENWNATLPVPASTAQEPNSLAKGILTNLLNPHPYIFWLTIGTPVLLEGSKDHWASPVAFVIGMFLLMIAVKICVALALKNSSKSITPKKYTLILRLSSVMLLWIAGTFAFDALPVLRELFQ